MLRTVSLLKNICTDLCNAAVDLYFCIGDLSGICRCDWLYQKYHGCCEKQMCTDGCFPGGFRTKIGKWKNNRFLMLFSVQKGMKKPQFVI